MQRPRRFGAGPPVLARPKRVSQVAQTASVSSFKIASEIRHYESMMKALDIRVHRAELVSAVTRVLDGTDQMVFAPFAVLAKPTRRGGWVIDRKYDRVSASMLQIYRAICTLSDGLA